jgi:CubicO group peptidase (beta-lactamase class C family)
VVGGERTLHVTEAPQPGAEVLQAAAEYAEAMDSFALLVHHRGALILERYWHGHGVDTRFDTASMHKSVLAMVLGLAIADGHIPDLDTPASRYLDEWAHDARAQITLRDLATMASGLRVESFRPTPTSPGMRLLLSSDLVNRTLAVPAEEPPGRAFAYLNVNAQALGLAVTRAVGQDYAAYLAERLWQPLGAADAALWLDREGGTPRLFCCLLATARAWVQVGRLLVEDGRLDGEQILPVGWVAEMTRPSATNPNYGLQVWLGAPADGQRRYNRLSGLAVTHGEPYVAQDVVLLDGAGGQRVYVVPSADLVIVRIGRPRLDFDDAILPNLLLRGLQFRERDG